MAIAPQKGIASQTFKILCLTYLRSIFKVSRKKNEKFPKPRNFHQFCGFVLHKKSMESTESKRTSYYYQKNVSFLFVKIETNLASVFSVKSWTRTFYLNGNSRGSVIQELIKFDYFLLYYTSNVQINNLIYLSSVIQNLRKENNIFQNLRTSVDLADSVLGYRGIGRRLDILLIWKFISK